MSVASLNAKIRLRTRDQILKQLTTDDPNATAIDDNVLNGACEDAIGDFERITGITHDTNNYAHVAVLMDGIIYKLETYKSRNSNILSLHGRNFYGGCASFRSRVYIGVSTNANVRVNADNGNQVAAMDDSKVVWNSRMNRDGKIRQTFSNDE